MHIILLAASLVLAFAGGARAGLVGDTVSGHYAFPNPGYSVQNFGSATVGAGVEFTDIQGIAQANFTDTQLILSFIYSGQWGLVAQSGPAFTDDSAAFTSYSIDATTTAAWFTPDMVSLDNTGTLQINWPGQYFTTTDRVVLNLTTGAVPEPMSMVLLGGGIVGLGIARRWRSA